MSKIQRFSIDLGDLYERGYETGSYKMTQPELLELAEHLREIQSMINVHDSTLADCRGVWGHLDNAWTGILDHLFGSGRGDRVADMVHSNLESIAYNLNLIRERDENDAYPCGPKCYWTAIYTDHDMCPDPEEDK